MDGAKIWLCRKNSGHALGLVVGDRLMIFRHAVEAKNIGAGVVLGGVDSMNDIECDICKSKRTWHIGEAALDRFMEKRQIRNEVKNVNRN